MSTETLTPPLEKPQEKSLKKPSWNPLKNYVVKLDAAVTATVVLIIGLYFVDTDQLPTSFDFVVKAVTWILPFFVISVGVAAYAKASGAEHLISRVFSGNPTQVIILAALFGSLSPFCSCGVIPIVAGLLAAGVPLAPVMAFWLSSPLMDPQMFIITAAGLSLPFAIAKTLTAFSLGLVGGFLTHRLQAAGLFADPLKIEVTKSCCKSSCGPKQDPEINWTPWTEAERRKTFTGSSLSNGFFLGKWLLLAFLIESLMVAYIPAETVAQWLGTDSAFAIPMAAIVGVPAYLNGFAAVPLISGLVDLGMQQGAAMTFLIAGGVTSIPAAMAVFALAKKGLFFWYLTLSLTGAIIAGTLFQLAMMI